MQEQNAKCVTMRISAVGVVCNVALTLFKLIAGIVANSAAMVADAVHSASDIVGSFVVMIGAVISNKAPDTEHPYGHEKLECIASVILGNILVAVGALIGYNGILKIVSGETLTAPGTLALIAAVASIVVKEALYWYTILGAKKINSVSLKAEAWHHRSDALSSVGSLIGIGGAMLGAPVLEPIACVAICLCILKVAYDILKDAVEKMLDTACDEQYEADLGSFIKAQEGVKTLDKLRTRKFGNRIYIDAEIGVDGELRLRDAHAIAERVHNAVEKQYPNIKHIMIHENPA